MRQSISWGPRTDGWIWWLRLASTSICFFGKPPTVQLLPAARWAEGSTSSDFIVISNLDSPNFINPTLASTTRSLTCCASFGDWETILIFKQSPESCTEIETQIGSGQYIQASEATRKRRKRYWSRDRGDGTVDLLFCSATLIVDSSWVRLSCVADREPIPMLTHNCTYLSFRFCWKKLNQKSGIYALS